MSPGAHLMLPWVRGREDRLFSLLNLLMILLMILLVLWLNQQQPREFERRELAEVAPGLARLILEKTPPPPVRELEKIPPPVEKQEPEKPPKEIVEAAPKPEPKPIEPDTRSRARQKAARSGLLAMRDELAELRDDLDFSHLSDPSPAAQKGSGASNVIGSATESLKNRSLAGSGGIGEGNFERGQSQGQLAQRKALEVNSNILASAEAAASRKAQKARQAPAPLEGRSPEEVERIFQHNKGPIFSIYNRALRQNPMLRGRVVVELTIAADGRVTRCVLLSSELGDKALEKRLVSRIKRFRFENRKVDVTTVTYPIDFLPS